jgi:hypothetical protein
VRSWLLLKASLAAVRRDKSLIGVQLVGGAISMLAILLFGALLVIVATTAGLFAANSNTTDHPAWNVLLLPVLLLCTIVMATIATYVAVAASYGALGVFSGRDVTIRECLGAANRRLRSIVAFGALSGTIGFILRALEERLGSLIGVIATRLVGAAWSIATMFVPAIIANSKTYLPATKATKTSAGIIKNTWGESLILTVGVGLAGGLVTLAYIIFTAFIGIGLWTMSAPVLVNIMLIALAVIGLLLLTLVLSTLSAVVNTAIYFYAVHGQAPNGFDPALLQSVFAQRKKKSRFLR